MRLIDAMYQPGKRLLKLLHRWFQDQQLFHPSAHGGVRRKSCFTSARVHLGSRALWTRDARDCFPSVTPAEFRKELIAIGFRQDTAVLLTLLCTVRGRIPQGSPVSNDALNLFFADTDERVQKLAVQNNCRFSRVVDDFVVSDRRGLRGESIAKAIENELSSRGIKINKKKRRQVGFQPNSDLQIVHSISVNQRRGTAICDEHIRKARAIAESYVGAARSVQPGAFQSLACKRSSLTGMMYYCRQANFGPAKYLFRLLREGDRHVAQKLRSLRITADKGRWWLVNGKRNEPRRIARIWTSRLALGQVVSSAHTG